MLIELTVGDRCGDGHGKAEKFLIESNLDVKAINKAYKKGAELIGIDLIKEVAFEYQDMYITKKQFIKFVRSGYGTNEDESNADYTEEEGLVEDKDMLMPDQYLDLYLFTIKLGNPKFEYTNVSTKAESIYIGGYGLFE